MPPTWDQGKIMSFLEHPDTRAQAVDLVRSKGCLLFFSQDDSIIHQIASEVDALFTWLGTPPGFTILLFWRNDPRFVTADDWPNKGNVNGGWTIPGNNWIIVYRQEEYDRVLLHECIHALKWDWEMPEKPLKCWDLGDHAKISPALFEAWTELYAEWLWCAWHNIPWETQRAWQDYQAMQILARAPSSWEEDTNVFAYYVLKAALAPHIAFLWAFQNGVTPEERMYVLCRLVTPELERLRKKAAKTTKEDFRLCMTTPTISAKN